MKRCIFLLSFFLIFLHPKLPAAENPGKGISWLTSYEKALQMAKSSHKPIVLFFTGSDWCGWCTKLEKESLENPEFISAVGDKLIFVKLDFPMHSQLDPKTTAQNQQLQQKFNVRSFPSLVIIDSDEQQIGITGYRAGGGKQYAQHLLKTVNEYVAYKQKVNRLGTYKFSGRELKRLYQKASELGLENDVNNLVKIGEDSDQAHFFLAEKYRLLVKAGKINNQEAADLKQQLLNADPDNKYLTHYQVAVIEFEANCENSENKEVEPSKVCAPLLTYMEKFGKDDKENLWRLNMVISQVYLDKNQYQEALQYAESSLSHAPTSIQPDISMAIRNIQGQINKMKEEG